MMFECHMLCSYTCMKETILALLSVSNIFPVSMAAEKNLQPHSRYHEDGMSLEPCVRAILLAIQHEAELWIGSDCAFHRSFSSRAKYIRRPFST